MKSDLNYVLIALENSVEAIVNCQRRVRRLSCHFLIAFAVAVVSAAVSAESPPSRFKGDGDEFLDSYRTKYASLKEEYQNALIAVSVAGYRGPETKPDHFEYDYKYYSRGGSLLRLDKDGPTKLDDQSQDNLERYIFVNEYGFQLALNSGMDGDLILVERQADSTEARIKLQMEGVPCCAYSLYGVPLENFIYDTPGYDNYRLTKFEPTEYRGRQSILLGAEFSYDNLDCSWEVVLDKEFGVVLSYTMAELKGSPNVQWRRGEVNFRFGEKGVFPELTGFMMWDEVGANRKEYNKATHTVIESFPEAPSKDVFYPSSIGIDIDLESGVKFWWFVGAGVLVVAGMVGASKFYLRKYR